jgi:hypothetical protein
VLVNFIRDIKAAIMETTKNNSGDGQKRGACGKICATCGLCGKTNGTKNGAK